jgi:hypothetical protein
LASWVAKVAGGPTDALILSEVVPAGVVAADALGTLPVAGHDEGDYIALTSVSHD